MDEQDERFGPVRVTVQREAGLVEVTGDGIPQALLRRSEAGPRYPHAPIGTRDAERLDLLVGGQPWDITPTRGGITRRSYRVDVQCDDGHLRLVPSSDDRSTLLRDGHQLGRLWTAPEDDVSAFWRESAEVEPADAAIGYALAAAFGTGAQPWYLNLLSALPWL